MTLVKWNPYRSSNLIDQSLENLLEDLNPFWSHRLASVSAGSFAPAVDITEKKDGFFLQVELPGVSREDVKITLEEDVLTISGEKKGEKRAEEDCAVCGERHYGVFNRRFRLGSPVNADAISAEYKDGVLRLAIPKTEAAKPREIKIQ